MPSATLVRRIVQNTDERWTSRNHRRSTKNPERTDKRNNRATTTPNTMSGHRRRPRFGTNRTDTRFPTSAQPRPEEKRPSDASGAPGGAALSLSPGALEEIERVLQARHRNQPDAGVGRSGLREVLLRDEEDVRSRAPGRDQLLPHPADRIDIPVPVDRAGPRDRHAAGEVGGREEVVEPERPHQPGRRPPDVGARDRDLEREVLERGDPDERGAVLPAFRARKRHGLGAPACGDREMDRLPDRDRLERVRELAPQHHGLAVDGGDQVAGEELA